MSCSIGTMARVNLSVSCCSPCIICILTPPHQAFSSAVLCTTHGLQERVCGVLCALGQLQVQVGTPDILRCFAGKDNLDKDPSFLSIEQALADYAALIYHLKEKYKAEGSPVIAFGGSYGGMLAAWLRAKYPNAVQVTHTIPGYTNGLLSGLACLAEKISPLDRKQRSTTTACAEAMARLVMQGSIAASAPVRAFASKLNPTFNPSAFWEVSSSC